MGRFSYFPPAIKFLLIANIGIFVLELLIGSFHVGNRPPVLYYIDRYFALYPIDSGLFYPWQLISYMFLHDGFTHVAFNMLALWMFGAEVENAWGTRKFVIYYLLCGLGGAAAHLILSTVLTGSTGALVGASGAIFGLLVAFGLMFPNRYIMIYFLLPIKAKYFVGGYIALELYATVGSTDSISHLAHVGGAITGIIYLMISTGGRILASKRQERSSPGMNAWDSGPATNPWNGGNQSGFFKKPRNEDRGAVDAEYYDIENQRRQEEDAKTNVQQARVITQEEIDRILDKIAATGYQNLTDEERGILFEASKRMEERR